MRSFSPSHRPVFSLEVIQCGGFVWHRPGCAGGVGAGGWVEPVGAAFSGDVPVVVVEEHVVVSAQQDPVREVGVAVISGPLVDVVGFGPGGGPVTVWPPAPTVPGGQADALPSCVQALLPPEVDALPVGIEGDRDSPGLTQHSLDCFDRHRGGLSLDATVTGTGFQGGGGDE